LSVGSAGAQAGNPSWGGRMLYQNHAETR